MSRSLRRLYSRGIPLGFAEGVYPLLKWQDVEAAMVCSLGQGMPHSRDRRHDSSPQVVPGFVVEPQKAQDIHLLGFLSLFSSVVSGSSSPHYRVL